MINVTELKRGDVIELDSNPWQVADISSQTPSARGASLLIKAKLKNLRSGQTLAKTWRGGEVVALAEIETRAVQFLYRQAEEYVFMDLESYEQVVLPHELLGDGVGYLIENLELATVLFRERIIAVELPTTVELEVVDTAPALKGSTAQAQLKPATVSTGLQVLVPPYLETGERIRVDTRDGRFVERVK